MATLGRALRQHWYDNKRRADELPPGKVLCAAFSTRLHDWMITDAGLFTRPKRQSARTKVANIVSCIASIAFLICVCLVLSYWGHSITVIIEIGLQMVVLVGFTIRQLIPHPYRQVLEVRDNRIFAGKRDCGSLAGAYVQPVSRWNYNVMLYTREFPRGVVVASVNSRQDLDMLCANLAMHLRLDGHYDGDWPPSPQK